LKKFATSKTRVSEYNFPLSIFHSPLFLAQNWQKSGAIGFSPLRFREKPFQGMKKVRNFAAEKVN